MIFSNVIKSGLFIFLIIGLSGCGTTPKTNATAPPPDHQPNLIDVELKEKTQDLLEEWKRLANIRQAKNDSLYNKDKQVSAQLNKKFSGLEANVGYFNCRCDLKVAMQGIATILDWDMEKVFETGLKPAQGVPVAVRLDDQPLTLALEQVDIQVGHFADIRIDPNFKTILITYRSLDAPREAHE
ncbi:hypothetical protein L1D14_27095 [Vibrio tubiashii]|uniref:DotD/TraH family lipoprotein n=1 Tax=Vibrio tubiashii TaxID=29498 RepID=UPI001EFC6043|nr:hypothetical protein [Vibrio tubiashii]MCG9579874.1 hypothetical protein [Vibrio tubiashii]